jgi:hypothetical protein
VSALTELPVSLDLEIHQGADWTRPFRWLPRNVDLSDFSSWTAVFQVGRENRVILEVQPELSSGGKINVRIPSAMTFVLPSGMELVYQLDLIDPQGVRTRFMVGEVHVVPGLTR